MEKNPVRMKPAKKCATFTIKTSLIWDKQSVQLVKTSSQ